MVVQERNSPSWSAVSDVDHLEDGYRKAKEAHSHEQILRNSFTSLMSQEGPKVYDFFLSGGLQSLRMM